MIFLKDKYAELDLETEKTLGAEYTNITYKKKKIKFREIGFELIESW